MIKYYKIILSTFLLNLFFLLANSQLINLEKTELYGSLPIKDKRTISFNTDEGSYMNVDVSPDGNTILFDLLGDIYSIPAIGGKARQLTHGLALNTYPVWAPDGKCIAYSSDASGSFQLHVRDTGSTFEKVLSVCKPEELPNSSVQAPVEPIWTPDSKAIVYIDQLYHLAGGKVQLPNRIKNTIGFSKDGACIYYTSLIKGSTSVCRFNLNVAKTDTILKFDRGDGGFNIRLSPDGHWLIFMRGSDDNHLKYLMLYDLENHVSRSLLTFDIPFTTWLAKCHYSFSPDSKKIYIGYKGKVQCIYLESGKSEIVPFNAEVKVDMGQLNHNEFRVSLDSFDVLYCRSVQSSPGGKQLVFNALNRIYVKEVPHGKPHVLVEQNAAQFCPAYSPDGKWVAYVTWNETIGGHLWRANINGGKPEQLSKIAGLYMHPSWSPDGNEIVVAKGESKLNRKEDPGIGQIQVLNIKTGTVKMIADSVPLFNNPVFSADGKQIIYKPRRSDRLGGVNNLVAQLVSKSLSSGEVKILAIGVDPGGLFFKIRQILISPDNRHIVYGYNENLFLVPILQNGFPVTISDTINNFPIIRFAEGGMDPHWEENGKILSWSYGNQFFRVPVGEIISNAINSSMKSSVSGRQYETIAPVNTSKPYFLDIQASSFFGKGSIVLRNAKIITMRENETIEDGIIVIKDGRFVAVGHAGKVKIPVNAKLVDLKGKIIMPGIIDMHSHMYLVPPDVFPEQSWEFVTNLAYGVTTSRDPSGQFDTYGYAELIKKGSMIGPRLFTVGKAVRPDAYKIRNLYEANVIVHNRSVLGGKDVKQYTQPTRLQRQWLLLASNNAGLNMTNETIKHPLGFIGMLKDGSTGIEHNPIFEDARKDIVSLIANSGTYLTPCFTVSYQGEEGKLYFRDLFRQRPDSMLSKFSSGEAIRAIMDEKKPLHPEHPDFLYLSQIDAAILKSGGSIVAGSHGEDEGIGIHHELWGLQMGGASNHDVLRAATINGAKALGMNKDLGSIEVGKIADLIVLDKDPLENIRNSTSIQYVMKDGVLYDRGTMNIIWPVFKTLNNNTVKSLN